VRDKLAGIDVPFEVRSFTETVWADYLADLRKQEGSGGPGLAKGLKTVDDLCGASRRRSARRRRRA
jgi:hypothetical protein